MGSDTTERILEKKYKLSKSVAKEVAAEAREMLDMEKNVLWCKALERECLLITDARGLTKDGVPVAPKKQYYTLSGELLEPIVEDDSVPKKLRRSSRSTNPKSTIRRSNSDPDGRKSTRIGRSARLKASHSCSDLNLTGESALQGFVAHVLGGTKKLVLVQDNARGLRLSEWDLKSMASTTMSTCDDDISNASSNSGWKWGPSARTADILSTMSVDDLDEEDCPFRQLSIRFDTSKEQKSAMQAPKAPKRRGSFDGEKSCLDCPPPTTVLVRGISSPY